VAQYHRVSPKYWPDMRDLSTSAKLLGLYILTCKHRSTEGLFHLPVAYAAEDMELSVAATRKALRELEAREFVSYDEKAQVLFIHKALTYPGQAPVSEKQVAGAMNALSHVPPSPLWDDFGIAAETHAPQLAEALALSHSKPIADPIRNGHGSHA